MKRFLLIVLLIPFLIGAGTWTHREVKTKSDGTWIVEFTRSPSGEIRVTHFSRKLGDGSDQLARKKWNLEVAYSQLMQFCSDKGFDECDEIVVKLIKAVRATPSLTVTQATTWYDANYLDSPWKGIKLLEALQRQVEQQTGQTVTWSQFKTYVINNIFEGIDEYTP